MDKYICTSYIPTEKMSNLSIGYMNKKYYIYVIIATITIILNLILIIAYFLNKNVKKRSKVSMERMIFVLTVSESLIAIYWLVSEIQFYNTDKIKEKCLDCFYLSLYGIFTYSFTWSYLSFSLSNLKIIITDPIKGILKPDVRFFFYIISSFLIAILVTLSAYLIEVYGISPMLTCFLRTDYDNELTKQLKTIIFNCLPLVSIIYSFYLLLYVLGKSRIRKNKHLIAPFMKYISNVSIFYLLNTPMFILLVVSSYNIDVEKNKFMGWFSFISSLLCVSSGFIISVIRIMQGYSSFLSYYLKKIYCFKKNQSNKLLGNDNEENLNKDSNESSMNENLTQGNIDRLETSSDFINLERKILQNFSRDFFIGICHALKNSKKSRIKQNNSYKFYKKLLKEDCLDTNDFSLIKENINFKDEEIDNAEHIEFDLIEYAPKIFKLLRQLDGVDEEDIIQSLLPSKNKLSIKKTQGKGGSFFITTDDNRFIMKTITADELELVRGIFLKKFVKHIRRYPESLICRIYGIYRMIMVNDNDVVVILMRNIVGPLNDKVICKYDLKGSTLGRETNLDVENIGQIVMKDNNFIDIEHYLFMGKSEINRLRRNTNSDGYFLSDMELMDYSLFLVKISLNKKEIQEIFEDEEINEYCEKHKNKNEIQRRSTINNYTNTEESYYVGESLKSDLYMNADESQENSNNIKENINSVSIDAKLEKNRIYNGTTTLEKLGMTTDEIKTYRKYMYRSVYDNIIYMVSIIDYFQIYNFFKYLETNYKSIFTTKDKNGISCVPPHVYLDRFLNYINKITDMEKASKEGLKMDDA